MKQLIRRHPLSAYFVLTFIVSWGAGFALLLPRWSQGEAIPTWYGLLTFPAMLLGPALASVGLTVVIDGRAGLSDLVARMRRWHIDPRWYLLALLSPLTLIAVLLTLAAKVSSAFVPHVFPAGLLFGPIAGLVEEVGWTGFALPRMRARFGTFRGSLVLGAIWGVWHLPVVDFMGAASPHGAALMSFFGAFVLVVVPMRLLIGLAATRTNSVPIAQLLHASLTGSLAMLSPAMVTPSQEAFWYAMYGLAMWLAVMAVQIGSRVHHTRAQSFALEPTP